MATDVLDDLEAEQDGIERILLTLTEEQWRAGSGAPGWTIADVVLHLAQSEEAVARSVGGDDELDWHQLGATVDEAMDALVRAESGTPPLPRWQAARRASVAALRAADPGTPLRWVATSLKPRTLATTRLAEHWAHALDITAPLGIDYPDTARLRHIAWLGHSTLAYAFALEGQADHPVYCELTAPDGATWTYGPPDAPSTITGSAGAFCRVGARRIPPEESGLTATGPHALAALRVLRNYAA
jgi:uncharacterized protein (TIGR03084 family)